MKVRELVSYLSEENQDLEVVVSVDISDDNTVAELRAFGEIEDFMLDGKELVLLCSGETNCHLYNRNSSK